MNFSNEIIEILNNNEHSRAVLRAFKNELEVNNETNPEIIARMREAMIKLAITVNPEARQKFMDAV